MILDFKRKVKQWQTIFFMVHRDDDNDDDGESGVFQSSRTFFAASVDPLGRCQVAPSLLYCITRIIIFVIRPGW